MKGYDHFQCLSQASGRLNQRLHSSQLTPWPLEVWGKSSESSMRGNLCFTAERVKRIVDAHVQFAILYNPFISNSLIGETIAGYKRRLWT
jgi:hypothetical protein